LQPGWDGSASIQWHKNITKPAVEHYAGAYPIRGKSVIGGRAPGTRLTRQLYFLTTPKRRQKCLRHTPGRSFNRWTSPLFRAA
jgi:hypothetical protein